MPGMMTQNQQAWLDRIFSAKAAQRGTTVRRAIRDVEDIMGREAFMAEVRRRGYSMVENGGQYVIFCNAEPLRRIV